MISKPKPSNLLGLSTSEARILLFASLLAGDQIKTDYEKLAQLVGSKSANSAGVTYRNAKNKLATYNPATGSVATTGDPVSSSNNGTPANTPKKRKPAAGAGGIDAKTLDESPPKSKQRKMGGKKEEDLVSGSVKYDSSLLDSEDWVKPEDFAMSMDNMSYDG